MDPRSPVSREEPLVIIITRQGRHNRLLDRYPKLRINEIALLSGQAAESAAHRVFAESADGDCWASQA